MAYDPHNRRILEGMTVDLLGPDNAANLGVLNTIGHPGSQAAPSWMGESQSFEGYPQDTGGYGETANMQMPSPMDARAGEMYASVQENPVDQYMTMGRQMAQEMANDTGALDQAYELSVAALTDKTVGEVLNEQKARRINAMNALTAQVNSEIAMMNAMKEKQGAIPSSIQEALFAAGGDQELAQKLMRQGLEKARSANEPALQNKINTLMTNVPNMDLETATKIATGALRIGLDAGGYPTMFDLTNSGGGMSGEDMSGGEYDPSLPMADTVDDVGMGGEVNLSSDRPKEKSMFDTPIEQDIYDATGMWTRMEESTMAGLGAIGIHPPQGDRTRQATNRIKLFNNRVLEALAPTSKGDSVSVYALQRAQELIRDPGSIWNDPERARQDYSELRDNLKSVLDEYSLIGPEDVDKETWNKYREKIVKIKHIIRMMGPRLQTVDLTGKSEPEIKAWLDKAPAGTKVIINGQGFTVEED